MKCDDDACTHEDEEPDVALDAGVFHRECYTAEVHRQYAIYARKVWTQPTPAIEAVDDFLEDLYARADDERKREADGEPRR